MSFGFGFGFTKITAAIRAAFSPSSLFAANEPGVWYDPSDLSTLFQDSAGTTPVTAVEQPVGLMLDKSKGLVLGPELVTNTEWDLTTVQWTNDNGTLSHAAGGAGVARKTILIKAGSFYKVDFTATVAVSNFNVRLGDTSPLATISTSGNYSLILLATAVNSQISFGATTTTGVYTISNISVRELPGNHAYQTTATSRPVLSARVNQYLATETLTTQNVTTLAAYYRLRFEGTGTITLSGTVTGVYSAGLHLIPCTAGTLTSTVSGSVTKADLRVANAGVNLPPYQRVNTATDYDTAGFPHYLRFDGVDDWLVTNTITPGTDKVQVFAGVRKLSDAARGIVVEQGDPSVRGVNLNAPDSAAPNFSIRSYSATISRTPVAIGYPAPITNVVTGLADISGDSAIIRVNGSQVAQSTADQGTGNYPAYPMYIGRRGGTTLPFNGHLYSLIVRFGPNPPAATIEKTEKYINAKTGAY